MTTVQSATLPVSSIIRIKSWLHEDLTTEERIKELITGAFPDGHLAVDLEGKTISDCGPCGARFTSGVAEIQKTCKLDPRSKEEYNILSLLANTKPDRRHLDPDAMIGLSIRRAQGGLVKNLNRNPKAEKQLSDPEITAAQQHYFVLLNNTAGGNGITEPRTFSKKDGDLGVSLMFNPSECVNPIPDLMQRDIDRRKIGEVAKLMPGIVHVMSDSFRERMEREGNINYRVRPTTSTGFDFSSADYVILEVEVERE